MILVREWPVKSVGQFMFVFSNLETNKVRYLNDFAVLLKIMVAALA